MIPDGGSEITTSHAADQTLEHFRATFTPGPRREDFARSLAYWTGRAPNARTVAKWLPAAFRAREQWCAAPHQYVWIDGAGGAMVTYLDGDVLLEQAWSAEAWARLLLRCAEVYAS